MKYPIIGTYRLQDPLRVLQEAIRVGYRHIDTAELYQNEEVVGRVLSDHPDVEVTTKIWTYGPGKVRQRVDHLSRIDYLLLHRPTPSYLEDYEDMLRTIKDAELPVRQVGVSNFNADQLERILTAGLPVAVNQIELHPWNCQEETLRYCRAHDIQVTAHTIMGQKTLPPRPLIHWSRQRALPIIGTANHLTEDYTYCTEPLETYIYQLPSWRRYTRYK